MSKQYYALLIGIDDYPPGLELKGCINDLEAMLAYLRDSLPADRLHPRVLRNEEATRANIVTAFAEFTAGAQDGDVALVYFSGHGSRCPAPPEFAAAESADGKLNTLVCWDSRRPGGRDLFDKEVSYLIWQAIGGRQLHLATVFDCCHSGGATRGTRPRRAPEITEREVSAREALFRRLEGFENYEDRTDAHGRRTLQPPRAEHVALAAAAKSETAKETTLAGRPRGVFTFNLLRLLSTPETTWSYTQLLGILRARVAQTVARQTPEMEAPAGWAEAAWLGGLTPPAETWTLVNAGDPAQWRLLAGQLQGVPVTHPERVELLIPDHESATLALQSVGLDTSQVRLTAGQLDPAATYEVVVRSLPGSEICITAPPEMSAREQQHLATLLQDSPYARLVDPDVTGDFVVVATDQGYTAVRQGSEAPRFFTTRDPERLAFGLRVVAAWEAKRRLENPHPRLSERVVDLQLSRLVEVGNFDHGAVEPIADWRGVHDFDYTREAVAGKARWISPAFSLQVRNRIHRPLWIAALYFGRDHSVDASLLPPTEVKPDRSVKLKYYSQKAQRDRDIIPLNIGKDFREAGITEVVEQVKIIVSTKNFSVAALEQSGLPMTDVVKRSSPQERISEQDEWRTYDLFFRIRRQ
jgi:hypothetical protein